jgi:CRISPR-associated protein Csb2
MLAISFTFHAGRYHATPWGRHVNEADVAWPPDLWRISRALIAVWHRKLGARFPQEQLQDLLARLAEADPPLYRLPEVAIHTHTRHYMPGKSGKKTLIFDAFVRVANDDPIVIAWPTLNLDEPQIELLDALLENLGFLGRAESWVDACRSDSPPSFNCVPSGIDVDTDTGEVTGEIVRLLTPQTPLAYLEFRDAILLDAGIAPDTSGRLPKLKLEQKRLLATLPQNWVDAIGVDTGDLQAAGWSAPPCAQTVSYRRPLHALQSMATKNNVRRGSTQVKTAMTTARFALYGKPLPRIEDAVRIGEALRQAAMRRSNRVLEGQPLPSELSGHDLNHDNRHGHAFWLPEDCDNDRQSDGFIDHFIVHVPDGLTTDAVRVLTSLQEFERDEGEPLRLMLEGIGKTGAFKDVSRYAATSTVWRSVTPYLYPWHLKKQQLRTAEATSAAIEQQVRREWALRGSAQAAIDSIGVLDEIEASPGGRRLRPLHFHRFRRKRGLTQPDRLGRLLELRFAEPIQGPLALGFGCHFGLGLFMPSP